MPKFLMYTVCTYTFTIPYKEYTPALMYLLSYSQCHQSIINRTISIPTGKVFCWIKIKYSNITISALIQPSAADHQTVCKANRAIQLLVAQTEVASDGKLVPNSYPVKTVCLLFAVMQRLTILSQFTACLV